MNQSFETPRGRADAIGHDDFAAGLERAAAEAKPARERFEERLQRDGYETPADASK
jgi:hypothetical protein